MTGKSAKSEKDVKNTIPNYVFMESAIGAICLLAAKSDSHKHLFASDYEWLIFPAIKMRQFLILRNKKGEPIAFVSWAFVNDDIEKRLLKGSLKLKPSEWKSGDKMYIIDIISPFISNTDILAQLSDNNFKDSEVRILLPKKDNMGFESKMLKDFAAQVKLSAKRDVKESKPD